MIQRNLLICFLLLFFGCHQNNTSQETDAVEAHSGMYIGQDLPGDTLRLFAPGIISTGMNERDVAFTYDGKELFFTLFIGNRYVIMHAEEVDGQWTLPEVASFSGRFNDVEPIFTPRGHGLYFISDRPVEGKVSDSQDFDIWYTYKTLEGWIEPQSIGAPVNTSRIEFFPSVTYDGTLYFGRNSDGNERSDLYRARWSEGKFSEPEKLPEIINSADNPFNACIAPDESYLIFCAYRSDSSQGGSDYYISFRDEDDTWSEPVNLGPGINTPADEYSPHITPGGKYFFFTTNGNPLQVKDPVRLIYPGTPPETFSFSSFRELFFKMPVNGSMDIYWIETHGLIKRLKRF